MEAMPTLLSASFVASILGMVGPIYCNSTRNTFTENHQVISI